MIKVKKTLQYTSMLQIAVVAIAALVYSVSSNLITERALTNSKHVGNISRYVFEMVLLSNEQSAINENRVRRQWAARVSDLHRQIGLLAPIDLDDEKLINRLTHQIGIVDHEMHRILNEPLSSETRHAIAFNITLRLSKASNILNNLRNSTEEDMVRATRHTQWLGLAISLFYLIVSFCQLLALKRVVDKV